MGQGPWNGNLGLPHCLPYFSRAETRILGADEYHGFTGPLFLETGPCQNPLIQAFFQATQEAGYALTDDVNGYQQEGFGPFDRNIHRGRRLSAARAYFASDSKIRPNLQVTCGALSTRILFQGNVRGCGVSKIRTLHRAYAGEIICCGEPLIHLSYCNFREWAMPGPPSHWGSHPGGKRPSWKLGGGGGGTKSLMTS
jgi:choline dehydrogenase